MEKILHWINKNKGIAVGIISAIIFGPILAIHILFKWDPGISCLIPEWEAGEILGYCGDVISFLGTIVLGYIAILQTEKANTLSNEMVKLEWEKKKPYLDIIQNQRYELLFGEKMSQCLEKYDMTNDMAIRPCYVKEKRTGFTTNIAVMKIVVQNIGNSDIRNIFIKSNYCYLSARGPKDYTCQVYMVEGNTYIRPGEKKNLFIAFKQELDEEDEEYNIVEQLKWIKDGTHMIPSFDIDLHLVTSDGNEYMENLSCSTSISNIDYENHVITRNLGTVNIKVEKIDTDNP